MQLLAREIRPDEVEQDITQRDQFNTDTIGLAETLVREAHQNSIDGKSKKSPGPVFTRFAITDARPEDAHFWRSLLNPLAKHLDACEIDTNGLDFGRPRMLVVEDFNTTGLLGAVDRKDQQGFSDFWRRVGRSHKKGQQGGRWGLGKLVFTSASAIRTLFGLTIQESDPERRAYLMGQAVLRHHTIKDPTPKDYAPHAFFAVRAANEMQVPETRAEWIKRFREATGLKRTNEPGLSVVVPFVHEEITLAALLPHVIRNWFFPIVTGQLVVEMGDQRIDASNFSALAAEHGGDELRKMVDFVNAVQESKGDGTSLVAPNKQWHAQRLQEVFTAEETDRLRADYADGKLVSARLPISIRRKNGREETTHIDLYLKAEPDMLAGKALFVRGALTVPGEAKRFRGRGCFGALVATDPVVAEFLGDAEGPAHTTWSGTAEKVQTNWKNAAARLKEIRDALNMFYDLAADAGDTVNPDALIKIFSVHDAGTISSKRKDMIIRKPKIPVLPRTPKLYRITQRRGGFSIRSTPDTTLPLQIKVVAAYDVIRGDPLKQYVPYDFDFISSGIKIQAEGAKFSKPGFNELLIEVESPEFVVSVDGFDINRDLFVKAERHAI